MYSKIIKRNNLDVLITNKMFTSELPMFEDRLKTKHESIIDLETTVQKRIPQEITVY